MKSPHTLIALHNRAICIQEMIAEADKYKDKKLAFAQLIRKGNLFIYSNRDVPKFIKEAWKYRRISNYLQTRYTALLNNLNH